VLRVPPRQKKTPSEWDQKRQTNLVSRKDEISKVLSTWGLYQHWRGKDARGKGEETRETHTLPEA